MGIKNPFKKKPALTNIEINNATADFIEVESYSGGTYHAVPNLDRTGASFGKSTLCGYEDWLRTPSSSPIDAEIASKDTSGFFWQYCPKCRDALILIESGKATVESFPNTELLDLKKNGLG